MDYFKDTNKNIKTSQMHQKHANNVLYFNIT